jgi:hypothetical protein
VKRGFTLFLLFLFLLNVLGYYGVFLGLQFKNAQEMKALFDNDNYLPEEEVVIKVPITVPYATDSRSFTRVDGEFEHQGEVYRMVKQRYLSDTLFIVCVKDPTSRTIKQALADYVKTFSDKPSGDKSNTKTLQLLIKDYISSSIEVQSAGIGWQEAIAFGASALEYNSVSPTRTGPPPEL